MTEAGFRLTPKQEEALGLFGDPDTSCLLLYGGSRSGKTAFLCHAIVMRALRCRSRHAILRYHFTDVKKSIGRDTLPKIMDLMQARGGSGSFYELDRTDWVFSIRGRDRETGRPFTSEIWLGGLDDKERVDKILGNEYSTIYLNEASQISYLAYTTATTRLAENTAGLTRKCLIDCNPPAKSHWLYQMFVQKRIPGTLQDLPHPERYASLLMNPADNPHLPPDYRDRLASLPARERQRFLYGEWLEKRQGALFGFETIERFRVDAAPSYLPYAVVGIDPAVSGSDEAGETGIVSVGRGDDGDYYVLRDDSVRGSPARWASRVADAYSSLQLNAAVYETNQGGDMVEHCIKTANPRLPCHGVRATRGKALRADPVAALYEQGRVHHVGQFPELEQQMTEWAPDDAGSPDRLDALVWAVTYLMEKPARSSVVLPFASNGSGGYYGSDKYNLRGGSSPGIGRPPVFGRGWSDWGKFW